jgi:hypothetical protein
MVLSHFKWVMRENNPLPPFLTDVPPEKKHSNISNYLKSFYFTA